MVIKDTKPLNAELVDSVPWKPNFAREDNTTLQVVLKVYPENLNLAKKTLQQKYKTSWFEEIPLKSYNTTSRLL